MKIAAVLALVSTVYAVGKGLDVGALIKKAACALPCVDKAASKVPCKGKNLVESLCSSVDEILKSSEAGVHKCGIDKGHAGTGIPPLPRLLPKHHERVPANAA